MKGIIGKKLGMMQIFDEIGRAVPVTVIAAGPCVVTDLRTVEKDGYTAVQMAFGSIKQKKLIKPVAGYYKKRDIKPHRYMREFAMEATKDFKVGQEIKVGIFENGQLVDVIGTSKGKGYAGGMKRHNFKGGPRSHGSMIHRQPASSGSTDAARTIKGTRKPGRMGCDRVTAQGLKIIRVDNEKNLLLVRGAVPGPPQGLLLIRDSVKA
ncbi:MAG: 50S ribosomal protein L3 [Candidatus Eremiobacteraeota bacterium]|nr:50S ribosomal protein L3 [Candidatus Eremiobacteraeota bacterium]